MAIDVASLRLCLVTDRGLARGRSVIDVALAAARGGATMVQLREKDATTRAFVDEARALKQALAPLGVLLAINDRLDVALAVDADGLHVGQSDMPVEDARRLLGPDKFIGLSITEVKQVLRPDASAADYLGVGPIYPQRTKGDAAAPLGLDGLRRIRAPHARADRRHRRADARQQRAGARGGRRRPRRRLGDRRRRRPGGGDASLRGAARGVGRRADGLYGRRGSAASKTRPKHGQASPMHPVHSVACASAGPAGGRMRAGQIAVRSRAFGVWVEAGPRQPTLCAVDLMEAYSSAAERRSRG